jgi:phage baseplate assembly protein W
MSIYGSAIDFPFRVDVRGSFATTGDKSKIIAQSIASILETRQGERVMLPDYGIPDFVFEVVDAGFTARLAYFVEQQLNRYEPLVEEARAVIGVLVDDDGFALGFTEDQQRAAVSIIYRERGQSTPRNLVFPTWQLRGKGVTSDR